MKGRRLCSFDPRAWTVLEDVSLRSFSLPFQSLQASVNISLFYKQTLNYPNQWQQTKPEHCASLPVTFSYLGIKGFCRQWQNVTDTLWEEELIVPCTRVILMRFAVNIHTHLETLYLMKCVVCLPISYLLNSYLTIWSGSNLLNAEGLRERDSVSLTRDTKSFRAWRAWLPWLIGGLVVATPIHPDSSYHLSIHH